MGGGGAHHGRQSRRGGGAGRRTAAVAHAANGRGRVGRSAGATELVGGPGGAYHDGRGGDGLLGDPDPAHVDARGQRVSPGVDGLLGLPLELDGEQVLPDRVGGGDVVGRPSPGVADGGIGPEFLHERLDGGPGAGAGPRGGVVEGRGSPLVEELGAGPVLPDEGPQHRQGAVPRGRVDQLGPGLGVDYLVRVEGLGGVLEARQGGLLVSPPQGRDEPVSGIVRRGRHLLGHLLGQLRDPVRRPAQHGSGQGWGCRIWVPVGSVYLPVLRGARCKPV